MSIPRLLNLCFRYNNHHHNLFVMYRVSLVTHLSVPKFLFFLPPFFSIDPLHVVNSLLSHSCCYFLHPQISRSSVSASKIFRGSLSARCQTGNRKRPFINYVSMILAIFDPCYPHVSTCKIFQTPPPILT